MRMCDDAATTNESRHSVVVLIDLVLVNYHNTEQWFIYFGFVQKKLVVV